MLRLLVLLLTAGLAAGGCGGSDPEVSTSVATSIAVSSEAFAPGGDIPASFTCDGENVSPPLAWSGASAQAWALVVDDPDAPGGTYVHWVVVDIPASTTSVATHAVPAGGVQVENSAEKASYAGPCPPSGEHRYRFTVYALDAPTGLAAGAGLDDALDAISAHAVSRGRLTGTYARQR